MAKFIRMKNAGSFDVVAAVNLLGASVKEHDAPIGMFGSGVKYALAQAIREGRKVLICSGEQMWTLCYRTEEFRGKQFKVVYLKGQKGAPKKTAITSEFGSKDWTDPWFIFREFYSNMLDEQGSAELVDEPVCEEGVTSVYLEYRDEFAEIYDNLEDYFADFDGLRSGTGRVFKCGVYVGTLDGFKVDLSDQFVQITETRTMNRFSAILRLRDWVKSCTNVDVLIDFWRSDLHDLMGIEFNLSGDTCDNVAKAHHEALENAYPNYVITPNMEQYVKDAQMMGYTPVIENSSWTLDHHLLRRFDRERESLFKRDPDTREQKMLDQAMMAISCLIPASVRDSVTIKVAVDKNTAGTAKGNGITISEQTFRTRRELVHTLLHELNHVKTGAGDYDRPFAQSYEEMLLDLIM